MGEEMKRHRFIVAVAAGLLLVNSSSWVQATPYASGISKSGTSVTYVLNEDADSLTFTVNGTPTTYLFSNGDPQTQKGSHTVNLTSPTDTFSFAADKTEDGFTSAPVGTITKIGAGWSQDTAAALGVLISADSNVLNRFPNPRGVSVSLDPNAPNFGTAYISNSTPGTTTGVVRSVGRGIYAVKADQSDAYGYLNTAQQSTFFSTASAEAPGGTTVSANTPFHMEVTPDGNVWVSGFADGLSGVFRMNPNLTTLDTVLNHTWGPTALPAGYTHGSISGFTITGSSASGDLNVFTIDEDLTTFKLTGAGSTTDNTSLWKYSIGGGTLPYAGAPTKVASPLFGDGSVSILADLSRGADGKLYLSQNRAQVATLPDIIVLDPTGTTTLFDSLKASRDLYSTPSGDYNHDGTVNAGDYVLWRKQATLTGPGLAADGDNSGTVDDADYTIWRASFGTVVGDVLSNAQAMSVSPDQKWMAIMLLNSDVGLVPLVNGIPDLANRRIIDTGTDVNIGRDVAWDAAGNLHYVSSGQALYRVLEAGGHTVATTSWNGSSYSFNVVTLPSGSGSVNGGMVPEPGSLALVLTGALALGFGRRRR